MRAGLISVALGLASLPACYQPSFAPCELACAAREQCPDGFECSAGRCAVKDGTCTTTSDGGGDDALDGATAGSYFTLSWPVVVQLTTTVDATRCERHAVLTPDRSTLLVTRSGPATTASECLTSAQPTRFAWAGGNPSPLGMPPVFDTTPSIMPTFVLDGPVVGRPPGQTEVVYQRRGAAFPTGQVRRVGSTADVSTFDATTGIIPNLVDGSEVTFDVTAQYMVRSDGADLFAGIGSPSTGYLETRILSLSTSAIEAAPALSPDGRVLVFLRAQNQASPSDLYVARRPEVDEPWSLPMALPSPVNSALYEWDPFIASNGDLIFTSSRADTSGRRRLFYARAML